MKVASVIVALAALAIASPERMNKRQNSFDPASATASLLAVLPSSILNVAITNQAEATTLIEEAFSTGTPAWFASLPTAVQSYFISQVGAGAATAATTSGASVPLSTGSSGNSSAVTTGKFTNSTTTTSAGAKTTSSSGSSSAKASAASSSSSSGAAAVPTAVIGGGLAGVMGLLGMLAL